MVGRYCSYLLPKQAGGTPQILVDKTSGMTGRLRVYSAEEIPCLQEGEHTEVFKVDLAKCMEFLKERTECGDIVDSRVWSLFTGLSLGLGKC